MARNGRSVLSLAILAAGLVTAARLPAEENEEVSALWDKYLDGIGSRDDMAVLGCYGKELYKQLSGDNTAAGRARIDVHMGDLFDLLCRSFEYKISEEDRPGQVIYTIQFKHKQKHAEHTSRVLFEEEDGRWRITHPPETAEFLKPGSGTFRLVAGIVIAVAVIAFLFKKALG